MSGQLHSKRPFVIAVIWVVGTFAVTIDGHTESFLHKTGKELGNAAKDTEGFAHKTVKELGNAGKDAGELATSPIAGAVRGITKGAGQGANETLDHGGGVARDLEDHAASDTMTVITWAGFVVAGLILLYKFTGSALQKRPDGDVKN